MERFQVPDESGYQGDSHLHVRLPSSLSSLPLAICVKVSPHQLFSSDAEMTPEGNVILLVVCMFQ